MFANFKLGIRDIRKNKFHFIASIYLLFFFHFILFMFSSSIYSDYVYQYSGTISPTVIFTSYEYRYKPDEFEGLRMVYAQNAYSYQYSNSISTLTGRNVFLIFGDSSLFDSEMKNQEGTFAYTYETHSLSKISISENEYPIRPLRDLNDNFNENDVFITYQGDDFTAVINLMAKHNSSVFYDLLSNTQIDSRDTERLQWYQDYINNNIQGVYLKGEIKSVNSRSEFNFIFFYLVPLLISLFLMGIFSSVLCFRGRLEQVKSDLSIHLFSGALLRDVLLRFLVYYGFIVVFSLAALWLLRLFVIPFITVVISISHFVIMAILIIYIMVVLNRSDLNQNLRGKSI